MASASRRAGWRRTIVIGLRTRSKFSITLLGLIRDRPRAVLDAGCGPGKIGRAIVESVDRIDAVDPSSEMIRVGRSLPNGDHPKIRGLNDRIEDAALTPPYALIVAGASFHWMLPDIALRRFSEVISPNGMLAILDGDAPIDPPWKAEEQSVMIDLVTRIEGAHPRWWTTASERLHIPHLEHTQFARLGTRITTPMRFTQSIGDYLRSQHSRTTWSEDHMGAASSREFDAAIADLLAHYATNGMITYKVQTRIEWGRPLV